MPNIETLCLDISDWQACQASIGKVLPVQFLVNNAGIAMEKPFGEYSEAEFDQVFSVNLKAAINISQVDY